jgi:hypothetical protein
MEVVVGGRGEAEEIDSEDAVDDFAADSVGRGTGGVGGSERSGLGDDGEEGICTSGRGERVRGRAGRGRGGDLPPPILMTPMQPCTRPLRVMASSRLTSSLGKSVTTTEAASADEEGVGGSRKDRAHS